MREGYTYSIYRRLGELLALAKSPGPGLWADRAASILTYVSERVPKHPGLFLNEREQIEARWVYDDRIISVTLDKIVGIYVFDRSVGEVVKEFNIVSSYETIANVISSTLHEAHSETNM